MAYRYKLTDTVTGETAGRYNSLRLALRELKASVPRDRFVLTDRVTRTTIDVLNHGASVPQKEN